MFIKYFILIFVITASVIISVSAEIPDQSVLNSMISPKSFSIDSPITKVLSCSEAYGNKYLLTDLRENAIRIMQDADFYLVLSSIGASPFLFESHFSNIKR